MYFNNPEQEIRKKNYARFQKMSEHGYSIAEEVAAHQLYVINEDAFGRAYYEKPLGQTIKRNPVTGSLDAVEEWAIKEFVVDNKAQLINKASADLLLGKNLSVKWPENSATEATESTEDEWLEDLIKRNKLLTVLYETAMRNSSLGDQYFELYVKEGAIKTRNINPFYVEIGHDDDDVSWYEIAWEFEETPAARSKAEVGLFKTRAATKFVHKKTHYAGYITRELFIKKAQEWKPVPYVRHAENTEEVENALAARHIRTYQEFHEPGNENNVETDDIANVFVIVEFTGVDEPLLVHWPNYRMFGVYGVSDTGMIESLQNTMNNRETQLNDVLDKHADPSMYGDASFLDDYGNLTMSGGGSRYFPTDGTGTAPGYLTWDSHLEESQAEIKRLYKAICVNSEISPALLGEDEGGIESGRALMYKLIRSLSMKARKTSYMKQTIVDVVRKAVKLQTIWGDGTEPLTITEEPRTEWVGFEFEPIIEVQSSLPTDTKEMIENVSRLVTNGVISKETALDIIEKYFDEIDVDVEKTRIEEQHVQSMADEEAKAQRFLTGIE